MSGVFLGKWWHWGILVASVAALWLAGHERAHVIHFNAFVLGVLTASAVVVAVLVVKTRPGEQVTRDRLDPGAGDPRADPE